MESKEKRKKKISVLTIFLWIALVITMSVVVVSGTDKSNALEDTTAEEVGITGVKRVKLDLREVIENEKITEQAEIEAFLEGYKEKIKVSNVNNSTSTVNADITYVGSEENSIGIYEINIVNEAKYIRIESNEYEILNNNEVLELFCYSGKGYYFEKLSESIDEYNFIARKKDTKIVTIKMDFGEIIKARGITEQSEIETVLENYASRLTGRVKKEDNINEYIALKSKYVGNENSTIGVYEVEITNDIKYIQMTKPYDVQYMEISFIQQYDILYEGTPIEFSKSVIDFSTDSFVLPMYIQKIVHDVSEYNLVIKKREEVTINIDKNINNIYLYDKTNNICLKHYPNNGKIVVYLGKNSEYDIIFKQKYKPYSNNRKRVYERESYNELEHKKTLGDEYEYYYKTIKQGETKTEYYFETNGKFESNIIWEDDKNIKLKFILRGINEFYGEGGDYDELYDKKYDDFYGKSDKYVVFIEKLDENFSVSKEYEKDPEWLIVSEEEIKDLKFEIPEYAIDYLKLDLKNNEYIPEYIYASLFKYSENSEYHIKRNEEVNSIYVKDKNMLYCLVPVDSPNNELAINLKYKGNKNLRDSVFNFNTKSIYLYNYYSSCRGISEQPYVASTLTGKQIKYDNKKKTRIIINKSVKNKEDKICYVGIFDDENESNTDRIYSIDIVKGVGSTKIEFDGYDANKEYYIYEVDENGNKLENENLIYNKNKVLEQVDKKEEYNILSDKNVISSVYSTSANEGYLDWVKKNPDETYSGFTSILKILTEDIGKGKGEEYYKNNSLIATEVYEDIVAISENNEKPYLVRYETKRGGKLEGSLEEVVIEGNKPVNVPNVIVNDGYEFDKWVVIKDGEEVEVNPSEYVVLEDTTFIAKYKEIKIEENRDTSDINVWLYVGIAIISIITIVIVVMIMKINKKRKTLEKR